MNIKLIIAYDGTPYLGWQEGGDGPTVEGTLRTVLEQIYQEPLTLQAASRTDTGVHAEGQVVNFRPSKTKDLSRLHISLNQLLPKTIRVYAIEEAPPSFHPTLDAKGKEYHYRLYQSPVLSPFEAPFSWHLPSPLDIDLMKVGSTSFVGTHDFAALTNRSDSPSKETTRTLRRIDIVQKSPSLLQIEVEGESFLYKMARNIVGTLVYLGMGKLSLEEVKALLEKKDRTLAGMTAPAHGLALKQVFYL